MIFSNCQMRIIKTLREIIHFRKTLEETVNFYTSIESIGLHQHLEKVKAQIRIQHLIDKALNSTDSGISSKRICEHEIVVSLTSYSARIHDVFLPIESIMQGSVKPNRIVLWLSKDEFQDDELPMVLKNQMKRGLEVRYCEDIRSYKKLIPSLKAFPESTIITIDDDVVYDFDLVEKLVESYKKDKDCIHANRLSKMRFDVDGNLLSYLDWDSSAMKPYSENKLYFLTGVGGVIYPPNTFAKDVFDEKTFMKICPTGDDIWFNAMARLANTKIRKAYTRHPNGEDYLSLDYLQSSALSNVNNDPNNCANDIQIRDVFNKYHVYDRIKVCKRPKV